MIELISHVYADVAPNVCPWCKHAIHAEKRIAFQVTQLNYRDRYHAVFQCPRDECQLGFMAEYVYGINTYELKKAFPKLSDLPKVEAEVAEISTAFVEIYQQASIADSQDLDQVSGVGYRKALEFLIKDYCCHKQPEKSEEIKRATLSQVISNYVENGNIKGCAVRAVWLGNDETHYVKKWEDKDINDLKMLINLTCAWIKTEVLTEKYMKEMEKS
ncbi:hypothetical protein ACLUTX_28785 [Enterobacterales bacterium AE_CKDN230030158-1A_HGKHYDSX7]